MHLLLCFAVYYCVLRIHTSVCVSVSCARTYPNKVDISVALSLLKYTVLSEHSTQPPATTTGRWVA